MAKPHTCRLVPKAVAKTCCLGVRFRWEKKMGQLRGRAESCFFLVHFSDFPKFYFGGKQDPQPIFFPGKRCPFFSFFYKKIPSVIWVLLEGFERDSSSKIKQFCQGRLLIAASGAPCGLRASLHSHARADCVAAPPVSPRNNH